MQEFTDTENPNIIAQTSLMPFDYHFTTVGLNNCKTLEDVVLTTVPYNFKDCVLVTTLNGKIVYPDDRKSTELAENDLVGLNWIPAGGHGGGKNVVSMVAMVALAIVTAGAGAAAMGAMASYMGATATAITTSGALGAAFGVSATAGFMTLGAGILATTAVSMIGSMAISALQSTPKQSTKAVTAADSPTSFIEGARNTVNAYGIVPVNLGTNRMFPNLAASTFTETDGNKQYCRQLFTYGYGKVQISNRKFGETDITTFKDYEIEDKLNADLIDGTSLYSDNIVQQNYSIKVTKAAGDIIRSTERNADEAIIDITFNGLIFIPSQGDYQGWHIWHEVAFSIAYSPMGQGQWVDLGQWKIGAKTTAQLRVSKRIKFPSIGQYDIKIRRLSDDHENSQEYFDDSILTAIKTVRYTSPINFPNISGTALRIKATDQLSGAVDSYNCIVTTLVKRYNPTLDVWENDQPSSNPADLFRYVLQSPAFAKRLDDSQIDLEKLAEWWIYCNSLNLTYNRVIDYDTSVDDVINDICAAGVATPTKVNNIYSVIIDNERPLVKGLVTPRNSWDYKGSIAYPELPHALRIEFRNAEKGYETDERIVYNDGYNESNATLFERLQFTSCTNADLAYWYGRRYFATAKLQPETHTFKMDFECMTFNRGDRISLVNDVILVGVGQGRIKTLIVDNTENPTQCLGFTIDDKLNIPVVDNLGVRIRDNSGSKINSDYYLLAPQSGVSDSFEFATPLTYSNAPAVGSLCAFVEDGKELDLIITGIKTDKNQSATITAIDYAPERFRPLDEIPDWDSKITISPEFYQPKAPILGGEIQSDEKVMIRNSDGSLTSVMIIPLTNENDNDVIPLVSYRSYNTTEWSEPTMLKRANDQVVITGLQDGDYYDFEIRYQRQTGRQLISQPLTLTNIKFIGGSTPPGNVENFRLSVTNGMAVFEWTPVKDMDVSYYKIKFTSAIGEGAAWESSQVLYDKVTANTVTGVLRKGTYLIKAYDLSGYESPQATIIISEDTGAFTNVVEELKQETSWSGTKVNTYVNNNRLKLSGSNTYGSYNFYPATLDLGEVYECTLSSAILASLTEREGVSGFLIRDVAVIRDLADVRSFTNQNWSVELQMNLSVDNVNWSGWQLFTSSQQSFRYAKFRLIISCESEIYTPQIINASVIVDMPDRYENEEDVEITNASSGKTIIYTNAFRNNPSVQVTVQNGAVDDRIEYTSKTSEGFTIKIFNATSNTYVARTFDYIAAGYGKVVQ